MIKKYPGQFKQRKIIDVWLSNNAMKSRKIYIKVIENFHHAMYAMQDHL